MNFVATLPEADGYEQNNIKHKPDTVQPEPEIMQLEPDTVELNLRRKQQTGKLQKVLADLRVSTLPIPEQVRMQLVEVVKEKLDALEASPTDLGRTSMVEHTVKSGSAKPFRQKLRPILIARR